MSRPLLRRFQTRFLYLTAVSLVAAMVAASAQTVEVPRTADGSAVSQDQYRRFDSTRLKDRPYSLDLPKPQFPSSPRVQRDFVVEYVYDYAFSTYTPEVKVPTVAPAQMKRDTPENALIALYSSMRAGDFENWVKGWDKAGQERLLDENRTGKVTIAAWKKVWAEVFAGNRVVNLVDRVETQEYVILDVALPGTDLKRVPTVLKLVNGQWLSTNELSNNPIMYQFKPGLAGIVNYVPPMPVQELDPGNPQQAQSQQQFIHEHTVRNSAVQTGR